jgi:hypothetical protein
MFYCGFESRRGYHQRIIMHIVVVDGNRYVDTEHVYEFMQYIADRTREQGDDAGADTIKSLAAGFWYVVART